MPFLSCALWFGFSEADDRLIGTGLNLISEQFIGNGKKRNSTEKTNQTTTKKTILVCIFHSNENANVPLTLLRKHYNIRYGPLSVRPAIQKNWRAEQASFNRK